MQACGRIQLYGDQHFRRSYNRESCKGGDMKERQLETAFTYRGYRAPYEYDANAKMWTGGLRRGNIFVKFGSDTEQETEEEFRSLLDAYLKDCAENGEKPEPTDKEV